MIYTIREWDDTILRTTAEPVKEIDSNILQIVDNMVETMYHIGAVGLAANQCGIPLRIMLIDRRATNESPIIAINPTIIQRSKQLGVSTEGCFSLPGVFGLLLRYKKVALTALDQNGIFCTHLLGPDNWYSIAAQHELDHLNGIFFTDYAFEIWEDMTQITSTYKDK